MIDSTLIYGLATMGFGFLAVVVRYGFKSKCSDVSLCCGLLAIKRDVKEEVKAEQIELSLGRQHSMDSPTKEEMKI